MDTKFVKKIGIVVFVLFVVEVAGCGWFFNQDPACPNGYDETVQGCKGMPPLPVGVGQDASLDASNDATDSDTRE